MEDLSASAQLVTLFQRVENGVLSRSHTIFVIEAMLMAVPGLLKNNLQRNNVAVEILNTDLAFVLPVLARVQ